MKLIVATVHSSTVNNIMAALEGLETLSEIIITEAEDTGQKLTAGPDPLNSCCMKKRIEIPVPDALIEAVVEIIGCHGRTGKKNEGIILILPIEKIVLI